MNNNTPAKLTYEQTERDTQTGCAAWEVFLDGTQVGTIEKDTVWCGDGYRADSYSVVLDVGSDEAVEDCYQVANSWSYGKGATARQAMAACKAFARKHLIPSCGEAQGTLQRPQQPREDDGQYSTGFDRLCRCGHTKGVHTADRAKVDGQATQPCMANDLGESDVGCDCQCFRAAPRRTR